MLKICLTGGIGCGKTTVAKYFAELGVPIIDADEIVHDLLQSDAEVFAKVFERFGDVAIRESDQQIDRKYLRSIVFSDEAERIWLENLLHPLVYQKIAQQIKSISAPYCIIIMPLFPKKEWEKLVDRILVVNADVARQTQRTIERDHSNAFETEEIIKVQGDAAWRLAQADDVVDNNGSLTELQGKVYKLHNFYLSISGKYE